MGWEQVVGSGGHERMKDNPTACCLLKSTQQKAGKERHRVKLISYCYKCPSQMTMSETLCQNTSYSLTQHEIMIFNSADTR